MSLLDGLCILFLIPNSEIQTSYLGISHKTKNLCNLEVLNADLLFMCEQINSQKSAVWSTERAACLCSCVACGWGHPHHRASSVCRPAAEKSPRQPGSGREGKHRGSKKAVFVMIKSWHAIAICEICSVVLSSGTFKAVPHLPEERMSRGILIC